MSFTEAGCIQHLSKRSNNQNNSKRSEYSKMDENGVTFRCDFFLNQHGY